MSEVLAVQALRAGGLAPAGAEWTYADLEALPGDVRRHEIVEGCLVVSPSPSRPHQYAAGQLYQALDRAAPSDMVVLQEVDLDLGHNVFEPDVVVLRADANARSGPLHAADLLLAVEVTSPSSRSMDRIIKPAALAAAGVPHYWRVDLDGEPYVEVFILDAQSYRQAQTLRAGTAAVIDEPFRVEFDPASLVRSR